ncbi:type II toxin-antitoxin system PemK/MazF family toxin [Rhodopseudomonas telluris]|uniref:Type II toxin-antitoxin system PemK/MazF family toxin n=1 Tax=Rhodopseudomonas telluris TaxID=644215 RepID=A0ABV6ENP3_9BRAD
MFERGDLLLVPFPFSDLSATKRRPVLVLTAPDSYGDFIALPVTSRPQSDHGLPILPDDLAGGTLPAPSWIRTNRIVTLNVSLVIKSIGRVTEPVVAAAVDRFSAYVSSSERS